ncbi:hypothetical protein OHS33_36610 [Streptomyces sp. NBC_00536]|uniref:hypothetical protein n=1 Tax=Streptomyces sp. NBC_00536 TaxID=2975769 RepID=UPI002E7FB626|nr:hypothetical protein [Streptomyces sp. NBC_00536]WUC83407.1 hypothetical protein OHS33_36610 [Streptomyces sp. NBC_00536]
MQSAASKDVVEFIGRNLVGRTLTSEPISTRTHEGRVETTYADQTFFSNFVQRTNGFDFDLTVITRGRRFDLDANDHPGEPAGTLDAVRVYRYEMTERLSTGRLLGFARYISSTNTHFDPLAGTIFLVQMRVDGGALLVTERQVGYGDFPAPGGGRKPQALDCRYRYRLDDRGGLSVEFDQESFEVDAESFERRPSNDHFPTQVSRELFDLEGAPVVG